MKASVRLIGMTAPIHDAEVLTGPDDELGIDNLVKFAEALDPDISGWRFIDLTWFIEMEPRSTRHFTNRFHMATIVVKQADVVTDGLDGVLVKSSMSDLVDTFIDVQYDSGCSEVVRETFGVMFDMVSPDFPDVFDEDADPRAP